MRNFFLVAVLGLAGCASVPLPPDAVAVSLVPIPSSSVKIHRPRFRVEEGLLKLEAYALRQFDATTTADTHVDIVFLDASGRQLAVETTHFNPRSLWRSHKMPQPHGYFLVPVHLPVGTKTIEVRAHDGRHPSS